jgi:hypothetical protein
MLSGVLAYHRIEHGRKALNLLKGRNFMTTRICQELLKENLYCVWN